ncbi:MAG TPA: DNA alkylation repair protein [Candidatus Moranbacteria bacterium]|nr:DNA alkylation repair protein [Candidatus Moranbacteria bacterium]
MSKKPASRPTLEKIKKALHRRANAERKKSNEWFFKTGKGQYGEGDRFIGVSMPDIRRVAKDFRQANLALLARLLKSPIHEERMLSLVILTERFAKAEKPEKEEIFDFYLENFSGVNNWDLVDVSAGKIVGSFALENSKGREVLRQAVRSDNLWERRLSIVGTHPLIYREDFALALRNAKILLSDKHDLIHKAVGWTLREIWRHSPWWAQKSTLPVHDSSRDGLSARGAARAENFLRRNYPKIPRTTLRYAIERMPEEKRKKFLKGEF